MGQMRALLDIPGRPSARGPARAAVVAILQSWELPEVADDAQLVVSELLSNAMEHAPGAETYELELVRRPTGLRIYLADGSSIRPVVAELAHDRPRGRGIRIVEAISERWGSDEHHGGKRVWVDLATTSSP